MNRTMLLLYVATATTVFPYVFFKLERWQKDIDRYLRDFWRKELTKK